MNTQQIRQRVLAAVTERLDGEFAVDIPEPQAQMDGSLTLRVVLRPSGAAVPASNTAGIARMLGLPDDVVGQKYRLGTKTFEVTGFNVGRPKNPVALRCVATGRSFKCAPEYLNSGVRI